jgi:hypothetical protein
MMDMYGHVLIFHFVHFPSGGIIGIDWLLQGLFLQAIYVAM